MIESPLPLFGEALASRRAVEESPFSESCLRVLSHFSSYIHSLPMGKPFTARAFIGVIGGLRNLSIELLEVTTRNGISFLLV
jgi:hypothetical protein